MPSDTAFGYNGQTLRINLTNNNMTTEATGKILHLNYSGEAGFVVYYLLK